MDQRPGAVNKRTRGLQETACSPPFVCRKARAKARAGRAAADPRCIPFTGYTLQAMGLGVQSAILTFSRQGLLNIPLLILMNWLTGLYGMIWVQLMVEVIMLPVSLGMYFVTLRRIRKEEAAAAASTTGR